MNIKSAPFGISVIICTHNGAERLIPTLEALEHQNIPMDLPWEILMIDNGSTDNAFSVADDFRKSLKKNIIFRIIREPVLGKSNALVKGYDEAKYELMLVCDDDNWLQPEYLKTVAEIFRKNPETGLLGGYGIAEFRGEEKPEWFDTCQHYYACGKHHASSGWLSSGDSSIWGAGSVIRKTLWYYLRKNGFHFIHSTSPGKAIGEDEELSHAVMFTGCKLYFDERLWFYHDLSGNRVSPENQKNLVPINGRLSALIITYLIAFKNSPGREKKYNPSFFRMIFSLIVNLLLQYLKKNNVFLRRHLFIQLIELACHRKKYKAIYNKIFPWISKVKESFPLKGTSL